MKVIKQKVWITILVAIAMISTGMAAPVEALAADTMGLTIENTAAPDVEATAVTHNKIQINWYAEDENEGYEVYRSNTKVGPYNRVATINDEFQDAWNDTNVKTGTRYYYKVRAFHYDEKDIFDENGYYVDSETVIVYSSFSRIVSAVTELNKPSLTAKYIGKTKVKLTWNKISGASGYQIYKYNNSKRKYTKVKTIKKGSAKNWTSKAAKTTSKVKYKIRAYKKVDGKNIYSSYSKVASAALQVKKVKKTNGSSTVDIVYITRTGAKFHRGSCRYLRESKIKISRSNAIAQGYEPCKVCRP